MAYSSNILPRASAYYTLNGASINGSDLVIEAGGYAEVQITSQMLPKMTSKMLVVAHPSRFSSSYANDGPQVTISIITSSGDRIEYLIPISESDSGVFNTELDLPEEEFYMFTYRLSSPVPVAFYNWELCALEASDFTTIIDGVTQEIPKLLYDYNTYSYAVAQRETTVGLISAFLHSPTDLQGHFTISFFATERCNVHVRVKDNGITELFSPLVYTVEKGYASVSIPHAYLKKLATAHAFSVTLQCSNGQISIPVRGVLYTIDGGYLATRLLDAGMDVQDISIRQLSTDNSPSEIHAVGFEGNRIVLKSRVYSQLQSANWAAIKDFGEGIDTAVEFNGSWTLRPGASKFTIDTDAQPYVFIVDTDKVLKVYHNDNVEQLDTGVDKVAACRGYNSMYTRDDQGLVVAYIKDGNVYYRQYLYDSNVERYRWYIADVVYEVGDASFVSIHRLPDYRIGLCITHSAGTKWLITTRTYVSQGIKPELVSVSSKGANIFTVMDVALASTSYGTATLNEFSDDKAYHNGFVMTFPYRLHFIEGKTFDDLKERFVVYVGSKVVETASITLSNNVITVILKEDVKGGNTVKIEFKYFYLVTVLPNGCYSVITQSYSWTLPLPIQRTAHNEGRITTSVRGSLTAIVRPLATTVQPVHESIPINIMPILECAVKELISHNKLVSEEIDASIRGTLTAEVSRVGTTPV